jgi:uncharacterized Tic20 family protein
MKIAKCRTSNTSIFGLRGIWRCAIFVGDLLVKGQDFGWHSEHAFMATQWFYAERGEQRGPIGFEELKARADQGSLRPEDLVWGEGMPQWKPASQVDGLFASPRTAPPPLPGQSSGSPPYESWDADYRTGATYATSPDTVDSESRQWAMLLHFSVLAGFLVPFAGLIVPILIWQLKKNDLPWLDIHGKNVANWIISKLIYFGCCVLLVFVIIGVPMLIVLGICALVFPVIGGIKASSGEVWKYPMAISFVK